MTRVLVLGGSGFIGRHVIRVMIESGLEPLVADLFPNPEAPFIKADYTDESSVMKMVAGMEVVVHLAWTTTPQSGTNDPARDVITNVLGSLNVFKACVLNKVRRVVFCSSGGAVYGKPTRLPIVESDALNPLSSYGITKLAVEKYLQLFSNLHGLEYMILRPGNAYGEGQVGSKDQGVVAACMAAARDNQKFVVWGDGSVMRDYVHVKDIGRAILAASLENVSNRTFNVGSGQGLSIRELINLIAGVTRRTIDVDYTSQRKIDVPANILDSSLAHELLGWKPEVSIGEGLEKQWRSLTEPLGDSASDDSQIMKVKSKKMGQVIN